MDVQAWWQRRSRWQRPLGCKFWLKEEMPQTQQLPVLPSSM
jgi:hypothetical protein